MASPTATFNTSDPTSTLSQSATATPSGSTTSTSTSSPLLFFVALGFGVLFTNLWIIVGVKYCFRYSQRNRRGAQFEEEVDLATLHPFVGLHHPVQRRRREKKLLKIEEVDERFPTMTYKAWRAQRERAGLSAAGGIAAGETAATPMLSDSPPETPSGSAPEIRPPSPSSPVPPPESDHTEPTEINPSPAMEKDSADIISEKSPATITTVPAPSGDADEPLCIPSSSKHRDSTFTEAEDDEDHDTTPVPDELLAQAGDNCAICIELLEDEDEVRGLTCGHCYHQTCIDPWLTQRRASCPLCKADYYVPKPALQQTTSADPSVDPSADQTLHGTPPPTAVTGTGGDHWTPFLLRSFRTVPHTNSSAGTAVGPPYPPPFTRFDRSRRNTTAGETNDPTTSSIPPQSTPPRSSFFPRMHVSNPFRRNRPQDVPPAETADPSSLERGEAHAEPPTSPS